MRQRLEAVARWPRVSDDAWALRLEGATKEYAHEGRALRALDEAWLDVEQGEMLAVLGKSGSGKSTLLSLCGLMDAPTAGRVLHRDQDFSRASERARARERLQGIGFVFQHFYLVPTLTAEENVALPMKAANVAAPERDARMKRLFDAVEMNDRRTHYPHQLSGGEQQRVAVARALANDPWLVLADEPTGELDAESASRVLALLARAHADGATVLLVTHDERSVPEGARRVRLDHGRLIA